MEMTRMRTHFAAVPIEPVTPVHSGEQDISVGFGKSLWKHLKSFRMF